MEQSPSWEANRFAASQEIPRNSQNPKVHYRTHKRPPPFCILGQPYPVHIPTSHLLEIHPNIIHPSTSRSPEWYCYYYYYSVEQNPSWESTWIEASQEFPHILWNPKVHYRIHKCPSTVPILSQLDPVQGSQSHFLHSHFHIIFSSGPRSSVIFPLGPPSRHPSCPRTCYIPCPIHFLIWVSK